MHKTKLKKQSSGLVLLLYNNNFTTRKSKLLMCILKIKISWLMRLKYSVRKERIFPTFCLTKINLRTKSLRHPEYKADWAKCWVRFLHHTVFIAVYLFCTSFVTCIICFHCTLKHNETTVAAALSTEALELMLTDSLPSLREPTIESPQEMRGRTGGHIGPWLKDAAFHSQHLTQYLHSGMLHFKSCLQAYNKSLLSITNQL